MLSSHDCVERYTHSLINEESAPTTNDSVVETNSCVVMLFSTYTTEVCECTHKVGLDDVLLVDHPQRLAG